MASGVAVCQRGCRVARGVAVWLAGWPNNAERSSGFCWSAQLVAGRHERDLTQNEYGREETEGMLDSERVRQAGDRDAGLRSSTAGGRQGCWTQNEYGRREGGMKTAWNLLAPSGAAAGRQGVSGCHGVAMDT